MSFTKNALNILDVGCGTGKITKALARQHHLYGKIHAIDPCPEMIEQAKAKIDKPYVKFYIKSVEEFKNRIKYDAIVMRNVLHHIDDMPRAIKKCMRMLNTDMGTGTLVISEGVPPIGGEQLFNKALLLKEERHVFTAEELIELARRYGSRYITVETGIHSKQSIKKWLGADYTIDDDLKQSILEVHLNASKIEQEAYRMEFIDGDVLCDFQYIIIAVTKE
jgi:ubiquinone/menaquinone biosynthesis C-methylase UbiE